MNYLAHLHLSFDDPNVELGNFIGDRVRRTMRSQYSDSILMGVDLHHSIDAFTDAHQITKQATAILKPHFRLYSSVIVDVFFDYFLARHWGLFHHDELELFTRRIIEHFDREFHQIPKRMQSMARWFLDHNAFLKYSTTDGIEGALRGMSRRTQFHKSLDTSMSLFHKHFDRFDALFLEFYPQLKSHAARELTRLKLG